MSDFDFALGDNADMIRDSAARFSADRIAPLAAEIDEKDWFPREELWTAMGELGLHGIAVPEEFGGAGATLAELAVVFEEMFFEAFESHRTQKARRHDAVGVQIVAAHRQCAAAYDRDGGHYACTSSSI